MNVLLADPDRKFVQSVLDGWSLHEAPLTAVTEPGDMVSVAEDDPVGLVFIATEFLVVKDLDIISFLKEHQPGIEIVVLCDSKSVQLAENALVRGASSYLLKPVDTHVLENSTRKVLSRSRSKKSYRLMEDHVLDDLLGDTPEMRKILKTIYKIAPTTSTILITGESGTGKEFVSNIIHRLSKRADESFVTVNCGAIPENIVESELFGSRKGAFTGAIANKKGLFEEAEGGTLFLDEVAELAPATQVKLLRFLQNREIRRVGDTESRTLDVRIIAATNKNVPEAVRKGEFREDLYYRLNTFHICLPPLRDRRVVIPSLVKYFVLKYQQETGKSIRRIHPAAQMALTSYDYPGNIRELENIIEHAVVLAENEEIRLDDLPDNVRPDHVHTSTYLPLPGDRSSPPETPIRIAAPGATAAPSLEVKSSSTDAQASPDEIVSLAEMEKQHILKALATLENNQTEVAKKLGISRTTLWRKLQEHRIKLDD